MENQKIVSPTTVNESIAGKEIKSAVKLSALELNGIKLDPKHTLLTPDYLEKISDLT